MSTLHLMIGLPCSGKTTRAREIEHAFNALRLTPDEWHIQLFGMDFREDGADALHDKRHDTVEGLMWQVAERVLPLGIDVILDFGCWVREQRDDFRARAARLGSDFKLHYCAISEEELFARLAARNANLPAGTFGISARQLREWKAIFQPLEPDEL